MLPQLSALALAAWLLGGCDAWQARKFKLRCPSEPFARAATLPSWPGEQWLQAESPEALGWSSETLEAAYEHAGRLGMAAILVVDDGRLVSSWGCTQSRWYVASVRKSLMNAVLGRLVDAGELSLDATLEDLGIDEHPPPLTRAQRRTTLEMLLRSSSGICRPAAASGQADCEPGRRVPPGRRFFYNNWDYNVLASIVAGTGRDFFRIFEDEVARPIGMDFSAERDGRWERIEASRHPAYVTHLSAADMARFGLLYLRGGRWEDRRVIPEDWVRESTRLHMDARPELGLGYGHLWWVQADESPPAALLPARSYSAQGTWEQLILVVPDEKVVLVLRGNIPLQWAFGSPDLDQMRRLLGRLLGARG